MITLEYVRAMGRGSVPSLDSPLATVTKNGYALRHVDPNCFN